MTTAGDLTPLTPEEFQSLVERAGLVVRPDEMDRLRASFETTRAQLQVLHSIRLMERDPAPSFSADPFGK
jgi:hypothetical protein